MLSELFLKLTIGSDTNLLTYLSIYPEMNCLKIYLKLFELEILSQGLTQVFTLANKNRRRTELNENKISYSIGEKKESALKTVFYNLTVFTKCFLSLISLYTTPLFIVLDVINAPTILYNQSNPSYPSYTLTLIT
jgi:hypothetical protein